MSMFRNKRTAFLLLLPALALLLMFVFVPVILNFYYSAFSWSSFSTNMKFVGFENFNRLFEDTNIWLSLTNNLKYATVSIVFQVGLAMVLAHLLNSYINKKITPVFRVILFLPAVISITAVGLLWMLIYNPTLGFFNGLLDIIGLGSFAKDWLGNSKTAMYAVIMVSQWQYLGEMIMLFTVGLQKIPMDICESADIDGANGFQKFFRITVPLLKETILMNTTVTIIGAFMVFDEVYVMTGGGPGKATEVLGTLLYRTGFRNDEMGYASAIGVLMFIITFVLSFVQLRMYNIKGMEGE